MRAAAGMKCSIDNSAVSREAQHFAVSAHFVSTAVFELEYCRTCGGSCHGRTVLATYDAAYGATVRLRDAVPLARMAALKLRLVDAFVFANFASRDRLLQRERLLKALASRSFADDGMYVERGKVFVNLDLFALSCADGSFYPLMVPAEFLTPSFRQRAV
jgi:hypothetical protein